MWGCGRLDLGHGCRRNGSERTRETSPENLTDPAMGPEDPAVPDVLVLPSGVRRELEETDGSLGVQGRPFDRRTPFFVGLTGALGVAVAYVLVRGIADLGDVLIIIGLALFIAVGLNPIIEFFVRRSFSRGVAVGIVTFGFVLVVAAFLIAAVPLISHEIHALTTNYPRYKSELASGKGWAGRLAVKLHLTGYLKGKSKLKLPDAGGIFGAGKLLLSL